MHRIKMYHLRRKVHFVVMTSVFDTPAQINTIYDLKGSLVGRAATQKERDSGGVLKDQDLLSDKRKIHLGAKKEAFMAQLQKDAMFLAKLNIMDYSLLVGIHDRGLRGRETLAGLGARDSSTSQPGPPPLLPAASAPAALFSGSVTSTGSDSGQIVAPVPPAYLHTHSNTPFRRASLNPDLNPFSAHSGDVATNLFPPSGPLGSPSGGRRKRSSTTTRSAPDAELDGHGHVRSNVPRSASLGEDPRVRTLYPAMASASIDNSQIAHTMEHAESADGELEHGHGGDEDGDDDDADGDGDDEDDGETDESEYEDVDAGDSDEEGDRTIPVAPVNPTASTAPPTGAELVVEDGAGALGAEGFRLSEILRVEAVLADKEKEKEKERIAATSAKSTTNGRTQSASEASAPIYTYGPGQARRHPWTTRKDEGINSRLPDGKRGDEIYFLGIIDILQQYNANKRMETIIKVSLGNDTCAFASLPERLQISPFSNYATGSY